MDMSMRNHNGGNALVETDYIITANKVCPVYVAQWLNGVSGENPDVNPLYRLPKEIHGLSPQLILVGAGEFALQDSKDLATLCNLAGVENKLVCEQGQLHIYALGSAWLDPALRRRTDETIVGWMKQCCVAAKKMTL
jgi:acetyl esterase/lipase